VFGVDGHHFNDNIKWQVDNLRNYLVYFDYPPNFYKKWLREKGKEQVPENAGDECNT